MLGAQDVNVFFGDFGSPVTFNGATASGNFDTPSAGINFGGGPSSLERQQYSVTLPASAFSRILRSGDAVTVGSIGYVVKGREQSLDGLIVTYSLEVA